MKCHNKDCPGVLELRYDIKNKDGVPDFKAMRWVCNECSYSITPGEIKKALEQKGIKA